MGIYFPLTLEAQYARCLAYGSPCVEETQVWWSRQGFEIARQRPPRHSNLPRPRAGASQTNCEEAFKSTKSTVRYNSAYEFCQAVSRSSEQPRYPSAGSDSNGLLTSATSTLSHLFSQSHGAQILPHSDVEPFAALTPLGPH
jgi:hypothetical protein